MTEDEMQSLRSEVHQIREAIGKRDSFASRAWDVTIKLMVPVCIILGGAMIKNEVTDAVQTDRIELNRLSIQAMPPEWLRRELQQLQAAQEKLGEKIEENLDSLKIRLTELEQRLPPK